MALFEVADALLLSFAEDLGRKKYPSDVTIMLKLYLEWNGSAVLLIKYMQYMKDSVSNCSLPV